MCWYCDQIDKEISHYRGLLRRISERQSVKSLDILIATLEAEKSALHAVEFTGFAKAAPPR
jgi:hypothetical protein